MKSSTHSMDGIALPPFPSPQSVSSAAQLPGQSTGLREAPLTPGLNVHFGQGVDHEHDPDGPLVLPVSCDGIVKVVRIETLATLIWGNPQGHPGGSCPVATSDN